MRPFRPYNRGQNYLLPPDVNDWLSETHFARFLITLVTHHLDLTTIRMAYQSKEDRGAPPYDPTMMTALLLYCYCMGHRSSRQIETMTYDDLGIRFLSANQHPDHDTIATFRKRHLDDLNALFGQVLQLCAEVGLIKVGEIELYLDGTKMLANASRHQTVTYAKVRKTQEQLEKQIAQILREAQETDDAEDALYGVGKRGGGDVPEELADQETLRKRLRAASERLAAVKKAREEMEQCARAQAEAQVAEAVANREEHEQAHKRGCKPRIPDVEELAEQICAQKRINLTDADSRLMKDGATKAIVQAYNCQAVAAAGSQIIVGHAVTCEENDLRQLAPMAQIAHENLTHLGIDQDAHPKLGADAGYLTVAGVNDPRSSHFDLYIAPGQEIAVGKEEKQDKEDIMATAVPAPVMVTPVMVAPVMVTPVMVAPVIPKGFIKYTAPDPEPTPAALLREEMRTKLATAEGETFYSGRSCGIEPVFGQTKECRGIRRLLLRGRDRAAGEWGLICLTHNLLKLYRHQQKSDDIIAGVAEQAVKSQSGQSCLYSSAKTLEMVFGMG